MIQRLIAHTPGLKRTALSRRICERLDWRKPNGELKDMTCRVALLRMQADGLIRLPPSQIPKPRRPPSSSPRRPPMLSPRSLSLCMPCHP